MEQKSLQKTSATTDVQNAAGPEEMREKALKVLAQSVGLRDPKLAACLIDQANRIQAPWLFGDLTEGLEIALMVMLEMKPESLVEALLAVQMVGVHHAALTFLHRAASSGQSPEGTDANIHRATRLMRLFSAQAEAMLKLKGRGGQQRVTVEHVHVHHGGQAIVGAVCAEGSNRGKTG